MAGTEVGLGLHGLMVQEDFAQGLARGLGPGLLRERSLVEPCGVNAGKGRVGLGWSGRKGQVTT